MTSLQDDQVKGGQQAGRYKALGSCNGPKMTPVAEISETVAQIRETVAEISKPDWLYQ